ncbi:MAG: chorismate lyase, partial [Ghiorsea sp.]|nr:chorismate lyase [Ghiorsea sp.]
MIKALLEKEAWQDSKLSSEFNQNMTPIQQRVLKVTNVLTSFLEKQYGLKLDIQLHDQCMSTASDGEADLLGILPQERCLRRKVSLKSRGEVMFDAESLLPLDILPVELMAELEEGKRPLANLLSDRGLLLS